MAICNSLTCLQLFTIRKADYRKLLRGPKRSGNQHTFNGHVKAIHLQDHAELPLYMPLVVCPAQLCGLPLSLYQLSSDGWRHAEALARGSIL